MAQQIKTIANRFPECGRIRLGEKSSEARAGFDKSETLIFTSNDINGLNSIAALYGGTVEEWPGGTQTHKIVTTVKSIPVLLPADAFFSAFERWGSGGIAMRCDGEECTFPVQDPEGGHMETAPCHCLSESGEIGADCQVTARLNLVLPQVTGLGVWTCTTHSINAAQELPAMIELIQSVSGRGVLVPAEFGTEIREIKKSYEKYKRVFPVPFLRVPMSMQQIGAGIANAPAAISGPIPGDLAPGGVVQAPQPTVVQPRASIPASTSNEETGEIADSFTVIAMRNTIAKFEPWAQKQLTEQWKWGTLKEGGKQPLLMSQVDDAEALVSAIQKKQADAYTARKIEAINAMKEVGITSDTSRHQLVKDATQAATESTKALTQEQLDQIKKACEILKLADESEPE